MSRHCYRTTTLEFYEYLMPETREYHYETVPYPLHIATADSYGAVNYLSNLQDHLAMFSDNNQRSDVNYIFQSTQPQTVFELSEQQEPDTTYQLRNSVHEDQTTNIAKDNEYESRSVDDVVSEPQTTNKKERKKNIYRTKLGYFVEEPSSESEDDKEATT